MPRTASGTRDTRPLLTTPASNASSLEQESQQRSEGSKRGLRRLFPSRTRSDLARTITTRNRKQRTVDTRMLKASKSTSRTPPRGRKPKAVTPPRRLRENSKDTKRKRRPTQRKPEPKAAGPEPGNKSMDPPANRASLSLKPPSSDTERDTEPCSESSQGASVSEIPTKVFYGEGSGLSSFDEKKTDELGVQHLSPISTTTFSDPSLSVHSRSLRPNDAPSQAVSSTVVPSIRVRPTTDSGDSSLPRKQVPKGIGFIPHPKRPSADTDSLESDDFLRNNRRSPSHGGSVMSESQTSMTQHTMSTATTLPSDVPRKPLSKAKALLSRPFGRNALPPEIARKWVVEVSSAEWDADDDQWRYRLLLQRRKLDGREAQKLGVPPQQSFTTAFTWRSLADFLWLEQALHREFWGGLLVPDLMVALERPRGAILENNPVEADRLRSWLGDIFNGIRGQGEFILDTDEFNLLKSESMEAFLYHNAGPAGSDLPLDMDELDNNDDESPSFIQRLLSPSSFFSSIDMCTGVRPVGMCGPGDPSRRRLKALTSKALSCQSGALGTAPSLEVEDSFADVVYDIDEHMNGVGEYADVLSAQRYLVASLRKAGLSATDKMHALTNEERRISAAWKRFASSLSSLFAFEKDVEGIRVGDAKAKRENMPYRKLSKGAIDESVRLLAKQKAERSVLALTALGPMLHAFVSDLKSVEPSMSVYLLQAKSFTSHEEDPFAKKRSWEERASSALRSLTSRSTSNASILQTAEQDISQNMSHFQSSERVLAQTLSCFCRAFPIRTSRMAWRYLNTEATHAALVHSAAGSLRAILSTVKKDAVARMEKHHMEEERDDEKLERELVERINALSRDSGKIDLARSLRVKATALAMQRSGRWDSTVATAILEALGMEDPNVQLDQTSRELRMVRKYAVGLRDNLNRCTEAVQLLQEACVGSKRHDNANNSIDEARHKFLVELSNVFSCRYEDDIPGRDFASHLATAGVDVTDPCGWRQGGHGGNVRITFTQNHVGDLTRAYFGVRDSLLENFLIGLNDMLKDYAERIEIVEGFVYMECVSIQIEKCCSVRRAQALSDFERKTDITSAINIARKKRLSQLLAELENKMDALGPDVSQTHVKDMKDAHLESKQIKSELHDLALRRLRRAKERSTERVVVLLEAWAKFEESSSALELKALGEAMGALEKSVGNEDFDTFVYRKR